MFHLLETNRTKSPPRLDSLVETGTLTIGKENLGASEGAIICSFLGIKTKKGEPCST